MTEEITYELPYQEFPTLDKPKPTPRPRKKNIPHKTIEPPSRPTPPITQPTPEPPLNEKEQKDYLKTIKESFGFNTLNNTLFKFYNAILLINLLILIVLAIATGISYLFFNNYWLTIAALTLTIIQFIIFLTNFFITATTLKRNEIIVIRRFRAGSGTISKIDLKGKSWLLFDKKDKASKVLISWAGAITDTISGCKIIQISEGHPTNDNLNKQVSESEWDKDVSRLTKAKSVADLAEAELFNQGLLGLKWQDIVLIIIAILCVGIIGYLAFAAPDAIAKKTVDSIFNGTIQEAIKAGIATIGVPVPAK